MDTSYIDLCDVIYDMKNVKRLGGFDDPEK
jgi:hypothetical protein